MDYKATLQQTPFYMDESDKIVEREYNNQESLESLVTTLALESAESIGGTVWATKFSIEGSIGFPDDVSVIIEVPDEDHVVKEIWSVKKVGG